MLSAKEILCKKDKPTQIILKVDIHTEFYLLAGILKELFIKYRTCIKKSNDQFCSVLYRMNQLIKKKPVLFNGRDISSTREKLSEHEVIECTATDTILFNYHLFQTLTIILNHKIVILS